MACNPLAIVASIAGTLTFNLVATLGIRGSSTGMVSACASSGHALGMALDEIRLGRQKRMLVVGAEDCNFESIVPFCGMRALSLETNPNLASRPFDSNRNGFVGTVARYAWYWKLKPKLEEEELRLRQIYWLGSGFRWSQCGNFSPRRARLKGIRCRMH